MFTAACPAGLYCATCNNPTGYCLTCPDEYAFVDTDFDNTTDACEGNILQCMRMIYFIIKISNFILNHAMYFVSKCMLLVDCIV